MQADSLAIQGKADPLQALSGPECSRKLRFPDFMTTAQDGGKCNAYLEKVVDLPPNPLQSDTTVKLTSLL